jgi:hypothetical protein
MTYKEIVEDITAKLEAHPMIKTVMFNSPLDWLNREQQPEYPVACFTVNTGFFGSNRSLNYSINFWFLDKSGAEGEFETDVVSDMHLISNDVVSWLKRGDSEYIVDNQITWNALSEKFEDYISGITFTVNANVISNYGACDYPVT